MRWEVSSTAPAPAVWPLYSRPARWREWAPHVRGASGLGEREVVAGRLGVVWLAGLAPLPVRITGKRAGRSWSWRVGPVAIAHELRPRRGGGCTIAVELSAPVPLEQALGATYGQAIPWLLRRLAAAAESPALNP